MFTAVVDPNLPPTFAADGYERILEEEADTESQLLKWDNGTLVATFESTNGQVIVRRPHVKSHDYAVEPDVLFRSRVSALWAGRNIPGLEQMVYYTLDESVVVTKHAGAPVSRLSVDAMQHITPEDWQQAITTLKTAHGGRFVFDTGASTNVLFQPETGFTFIDFVLAGADSSRQQQMVDTLDVLDIMLTANTYSYDEATRGPWQSVGRMALSSIFAYFSTPEQQGLVRKVLSDIDCG